MDPASIDDLRVIVDDQSRMALGLILVGMMFTVALGLKLEDFRRVGEQPVRVLGGVMAQVIGLPLLTLGLILLISPPASVALGMLVVASCPGGNVSNVLTQFARGNAAWSVTLTAISSVSAAVVTPVSIMVWASVYAPTAALVDRLEVDPVPFVVQTLVVLAVPLVAGMVVAHRFPGVAKRLRTVLAPCALGAIFVLIVVGLVQNWPVVLAAGSVIIPIVVIHNAAAFGFGNLAGHALRLDAPSRRATTFEVGIQNSGLGLLILLSQFDGLGGAAAIVGMWSIWHLVGGTALVGLFRTLDWLTLSRKGPARNDPA